MPAAPRILSALSIAAVLTFGPAPARADYSFRSLAAKVTGTTVDYGAQICRAGGIGVPTRTTWGVYHDLKTKPTAGGAKPNQAASVNIGSCGGTLPNASIKWTGAAVGLYASYAIVDPDNLVRESNETNNVFGPIAVCVGPDLWLKTFTIETRGALVTYKTTVCNKGSQAGVKFRVGIWHDTKTAPPTEQMGNIFKGIPSLDPDKCKDLTISGGRRPNGNYVAWARADSGDFVTECREANNAFGPLPYRLNNPDLYVKKFSSNVSGQTVTYTVEVCNKGTLAVSKFFVDVYWDRPRKPPTIGDPGDQVKPVTTGLKPKGCSTHTFTYSGAAKKVYNSYAFVDADDFFSEPDEANNISSLLQVGVGVKVPGSTIPGVGGNAGCVDKDFDKSSVGPSCTGVPDCDDRDAQRNPQAKEVCGDNIDNDCDLTVDDGCDGVDCVDKDGDGFGVGKDCKLVDPDDTDKTVYPWAPPWKYGNPTGGACVDGDKDGFGVGPGCKGVPDCNDNDRRVRPGATEICGDQIDNNCDLTVDDGCKGVDCKDKDGDGFGVGKDCGITDPNDTRKDIAPWSRCTDSDGDGYGVGPDCKGVPDCNDNDKTVHPGVKEICGNKLDDDCDLTPDDNCPGVDCTDADGDGFGVGKACVLADCNDADKTVYPWAPEVCGDNKDDNCNKIADDGCRGRACVDQDMDGFGVGAGCPGRQDCKDDNFAIKPGAKEICGDGLDNDCDAVADEGCDKAVDKDGDGFTVGGKTRTTQPDCDDTSGAIKPGAKEICGDKIDNDCDGTVDESCKNVDCTDVDGDGWGVGKDCKIKDCNDADKAVHPWAKEVCGDAKDNNCNETVDDGCPGVACADGDGDSWPVGTACKKSDCDDKDAAISPWAQEICADGVDNDCSGSADDGCVVCQDRDGDGHGLGARCASWDCDDNKADVFPGAPELCDGRDNNCDGTVPADEDQCLIEETGCSGCAVDGPVPPPSAIWLALLVAAILISRRR